MIQDNKFQKKLKGSLWIIALPLMFVVLASFWSYLIPFDDAPDEWAHFQFNVKHILDNHSLPVSGIDDEMAFLSGRGNSFGLASIRYSYAVYPQLNYICAAAIASLAKSIFGLPYEYGSRIFSIFSGCAFLVFIYLALGYVTRSTYHRVFITILSCFIPQVIFISSYLNQDIHSLAISAFVSYACLRVLNSKSIISYVIFGMSIGLLFTAKYNYFIYFPALFALAVSLYLTKHIAIKEFAKLTTSALVGSSIFAAPFYIRNYLLYNDILGQSFVKNLMLEHQGRLGLAQAFNLESLVFYLKRGFFYETFKSFFAIFGYLSIQLSPFTYELFYFICVSSCLYFVVAFFLKARRIEKVYFLGLLIFIFLSFSLHLYNSLIWDYQSQGRYLFPIIAPIAIFTAYALDKYKILKTPLLLYGFGLFYVFAESQSIMIKNYMPDNLLVGPIRLVSPADLSTTRQENPTRAFNEAPPVSIELDTIGIQKFYSKHQGLTGVSIYLSENSPRISMPLRLIIRDPSSGVMLSESYVFPFELIAGHEVQFVFKRIKESEDKILLAEISLPPKSASITPISSGSPLLKTIKDDGEIMTFSKLKGAHATDTNFALLMSLVFEE